MAARIGQFSGPTELYGTPLAIIHPPDNNVDATKFHDALKDPGLKLTDKQRDDLQQQILELSALFQLARELP